MTATARDPVARIAMWSGPRNISTAMMRSFENRADACVSDEPFYACYLARTGVDHPMREAVLENQPQDFDSVAEAMQGPPPREGARIWYQKHMCQHMLGGDPLDWAGGLANAFLIRDPRAVVASFAKNRGTPEAFELGFERQREIFDHVRAAADATPPVLDAEDVLGDPERALRALCAALNVAFDPAMLAWPAGRRDSDGVWAPVWYKAVEASTGFAAAGAAPSDLPADLQRLADAARPSYEAMAAHRLLG
ncbi:MAG: hypothetical protein RIB45_13730 [Marivibrio sp.]|uniref:sulfotransferase-like domain-containing protein n=1 Tax=Marivibrio sp. TaxID=2039719 RepID=UPI0032EE68F6